MSSKRSRLSIKNIPFPIILHRQKQHLKLEKEYWTFLIDNNPLSERLFLHQETLSCMIRALRALTSPAPPRSAQRCSSRAPPWTSASAGSANRLLSGWKEALHRQTANPGEAERERGEMTSSARFLGKTKTKEVWGLEPAAGKQKCYWRGRGSWRGFLPVHCLHLKIL